MLRGIQEFDNNYDHKVVFHLMCIIFVITQELLRGWVLTSLPSNKAQKEWKIARPILQFNWSPSL